MNAYCAYCWPALRPATHLDAWSRPCCAEGHVDRHCWMPKHLLRDQRALASASPVTSENEPRYVA